MREEVHAFLCELHAAFRAGDPEPFIQRSSMRLEELGRAYAFPPSEKAEIIRLGTQEDTSDPALPATCRRWEPSARVSGDRDLPSPRR